MVFSDFGFVRHVKQAYLQVCFVFVLCFYLQCNSRWLYLLKKYKGLEDNKKKTGAGRQKFEYEEEMSAAVGDRVDVHPELLVGSSLSGVVQKRDADDELPAKKSKKLRCNRQSNKSETLSKFMDTMSSCVEKMMEMEGKKMDILNKYLGNQQSEKNDN